MKKSWLALLGLALMASAVSAQPKQASKPQFDRASFAIPHEKFVLDNGLTLIVHEDHSVPIVFYTEGGGSTIRACRFDLKPGGIEFLPLLNQTLHDDAPDPL